MNYKNNPSATKDVQGFNENNYWIKPKDRLELKAWKHVRHTGAHAPGKRANGYVNEFNEFMEGDTHGMSGLKQNCTYTDNSITLTDGMNYRFFQFVQHLTQLAIGHCANNSEPTDD
ncbi:MAG: hypothetical protein COA63_006300 [Methylophaga sp.]|nr:hypothetical protein [Methylophaga sp.]